MLPIGTTSRGIGNVPKSFQTMEPSAGGGKIVAIF
jgi:hypothetical protein